MKVPNTPSDESARLVALHRLAVLDTPPTESLDRITRLAAKLLSAPIVLISLIDANRQWFKSCVGLDASETSRDISFCGHVVFERRALVITDATQDPRFADNPLVTGAPLIRAYMGMPLFTTDDQPIGTLCAIDTQPRRFDDDQIDLLSTLAKFVEDDFRAKELAAQTDNVLQFARSRERLFRDTFEQNTVGMLHLALDGRIIRANGLACRILGRQTEDLKAVSLLDLTDGDATTAIADALKHLSEGNPDDRVLSIGVHRDDGRRRLTPATFSLRLDEGGKPSYALVVLENLQ